MIICARIVSKRRIYPPKVSLSYLAVSSKVVRALLLLMILGRQVVGEGVLAARRAVLHHHGSDARVVEVLHVVAGVAVMSTVHLLGVVLLLHVVLHLRMHRDMVRVGHMLLRRITTGAHGHHVAVVDAIHELPSSAKAVVVSTDTVFTVLFFADDTDELQLAAEHHAESLPSDGFLDPGDPSTVTPFVDLAPESISFVLESAELSLGEDTMAPGGVNVGDRAVDDGRLGGAADLRKVGEQLGEVL